VSSDLFAQRVFLAPLAGDITRPHSNRFSRRDRDTHVQMEAAEVIAAKKALLVVKGLSPL
jgi:hypothetical protein